MTCERLPGDRGPSAFGRDVTNVSGAKAPMNGKVDRSMGESIAHRPQRDAMTASTAAASARTRTGGPQDDGPKIFEHVMGWTFVVVLAMLVAQLGLI